MKTFYKLIINYQSICFYSNALAIFYSMLSQNTVRAQFTSLFLVCTFCNFSLVPYYHIILENLHYDKRNDEGWIYCVKSNGVNLSECEKICGLKQTHVYCNLVLL